LGGQGDRVERGVSTFVALSTLVVTLCKGGHSFMILLPLCKGVKESFQRLQRPIFRVIY